MRIIKEGSENNFQSSYDKTKNLTRRFATQKKDGDIAEITLEEVTQKGELKRKSLYQKSNQYIAIKNYAQNSKSQYEYSDGKCFKLTKVSKDAEDKKDLVEVFTFDYDKQKPISFDKYIIDKEKKIRYHQQEFLLDKIDEMGQCINDSKLFEYNKYGELKKVTIPHKGTNNTCDVYLYDSDKLTDYWKKSHKASGTDSAYPQDMIQGKKKGYECYKYYGFEHEKPVEYFKNCKIDSNGINYEEHGIFQKNKLISV